MARLLALVSLDVGQRIAISEVSVEETQRVAIKRQSSKY